MACRCWPLAGLRVPTAVRYPLLPQTLPKAGAGPGRPLCSITDHQSSRARSGHLSLWEWGGPACGEGFCQVRSRQGALSGLAVHPGFRTLKIRCTLSYILQPQGRRSPPTSLGLSSRGSTHLTFILYGFQHSLSPTPDPAAGDTALPCTRSSLPAPWPQAPSSRTLPLRNLALTFSTAARLASCFLRRSAMVVTLLHVLLEVLNEVHQRLHPLCSCRRGRHSGPEGHQL